MSINVTLSIPNISCHHCVMTITRETADLPGVEKVHADAQSKTASFTVADEKALALVKQALAEAGYPAAEQV